MKNKFLRNALAAGRTQHINALTATLQQSSLIPLLPIMNEHMQKTNPLASLDVIGGFELVAFYDSDNRFTHSACSCGWQWNGFADEMLEAATLHNMTHKNFMQIERSYLAGDYNFDAALNFAIMLGMNEGRACDWLENAKRR